VSTIGVGLDIVQISRVERLIAAKGDAVYAKLLTAGEREYVTDQPLPAQHLAARIAAKEAVYKALQALPDSRGVGWQDVEVVRAREGFPSIRLLGVAASLADSVGGLTIHLSLSHSDTTAGAVALIESP
jgi:holo-[acyl-carrier protein] synthase